MLGSFVAATVCFPDAIIVANNAVKLTPNETSMAKIAQPIPSYMVTGTH
jgi:hypothetical protein